MSKQKARSHLRTHYSSQLDSSLIGKKVSIAGWIEDVRPLGSLIFITVRDVEGVSQAVLNKHDCPLEMFVQAKKASRQSAVILHGVVQESKAKGVPVEVKAERLEILGEAVHPLPIDPTGRSPASLDARLDARPLDLRNPRVVAIFKVRQIVMRAIREAFTRMKFIEVNTPKIIGQAAEGGANLFALDYFGKGAYLAQSPQLFKEQLTMSLDRVFEIASYYRAEKSSTRRHLSEFVSVDMEAAFVDEDEAMNIAEEVVASTITEVNQSCQEELSILNHRIIGPSRPYKRITYAQAISDLKSQGIEVEFGEDLTDSMLQKLGRIHKGYYFITYWPTGLKPFYIAPKEEDASISYGFDLQFGPLEIASGGRRISTKSILLKRLREQNLDPAAFKEHLKFYDWGMPPHSGWALGLDRFVMILTGQKNIREATLYPRDRFRLSP